MNRASELIQFLSRADTPGSILLAPNAPPVSRVSGSVDVALPFVMDAGDIYDTLKALTLNTAVQQHLEDHPCGTFSFSINKVGRLRVHFVTQRGSKMVRLDLVSFAAPQLEFVCNQPDETGSLVQFLTTPGAGLLLVTSTNRDAIDRFVYALIQAVNVVERRVIFMIEHCMPYLLAHGESIIVQSEMHGDIISLEQGLQSMLGFVPNLLYVGDIRPSDALPSLRHPIGSGIKTIVSSTSLTATALLQHIGMVSPLLAADDTPIPCRAVTLSMTPERMVRLKEQK